MSGFGLIRLLRGSSEPPDCHDEDVPVRYDHVRHVTYPIKIAGVQMGSHDSLNSGEEDLPVTHGSRQKVCRLRSSSCTRRDSQGPVVGDEPTTPFGTLKVSGPSL